MYPNKNLKSSGFINAKTGQPCTTGKESATEVLAKLEELANMLEGLIGPIEELLGVEYAGTFIAQIARLWYHLLIVRLHMNKM